jgi:phosphoglycolate phosphatase
MLTLLGLPQLPPECFRELIGAGIDRFVERVLARARPGGSAEPELLSPATGLFRGLYAAQLFSLSRFFPGVRETVQRLRAAGLPLACITNKESRFTMPLLEAAGLGDVFALTLCADTESDRKPSPNLLRSACVHLDVAPARLLYVGDSHTDVAAARGAGCRVAIVDYGYHQAASLADLAADAVVSHLSEILTLHDLVES